MIRCDLPVAILDTETTGLEAATDTVIELAVVRPLETGYGSFSSLIDPGSKVFAWNAMAAHHIRAEDLRSAPSRTSVLRSARNFLDHLGARAVVAHNARFDLGFTPELSDLEWIDSLRLAQHAWPEAPSHKNFALFHGLGLSRQWTAHNPSHRALTDALATMEVFFEALRSLQITSSTYAMEQIHDWLKKPVPISRMPFGKHRGEPLEAVPTPYLAWALGQDIEGDLRIAIQTELTGRRDSGQLAS